MKKTRKYSWNSRRFVKNMSGVVAFISFFMLWGTVGANEMGNLSDTEFMVNSLAYLALWCLTLKLSGAFESVKG